MASSVTSFLPSFTGGESSSFLFAVPFALSFEGDVGFEVPGSIFIELFVDIFTSFATLLDESVDMSMGADVEAGSDFIILLLLAMLAIEALVEPEDEFERGFA